MVVIMEQKNIFLFKEALLQKDAATLLALFPFYASEQRIGTSHVIY